MGSDTADALVAAAAEAARTAIGAKERSVAARTLRSAWATVEALNDEPLFDVEPADHARLLHERTEP